MPARRRHFSSDDDHSESINMAMNDGKTIKYHEQVNTRFDNDSFGLFY